MNIDLSNGNLKSHIDTFKGLSYKPSFSVSEDTDVQILFVKRKDKYYGIRSADKAHFGSRAEFLVSSFLIEEIRARIKEKLVLENLTTVDCCSTELKSIFSRAEKIKDYLPSIGDIQSSHTILNGSDLNWVFLEEKSKYHSLFWNESESKFFSRCA